MKEIQAIITPVSALINIETLGFVGAAKDQLRSLTLGDIIFLTGNFNRSEYLNEIGETRMRVLAKRIEATQEYQDVKHLIGIASYEKPTKK